MKKQLDQSLDAFVQRHLSQLKILARLVEHELDGSKQGNTVSLDRELAENLLDLLEIFVEDFETRSGKRERESAKTASGEKPTVTRLN